MLGTVINEKAAKLVAMCIEQHISITAAESCTGGLFMAAITGVAGSSAIFNGGFVTYSNIEKIKMLGVSEASLITHGAVSDTVVREMAYGAMRHTHADLAIAISGIAGPTGGSDDKPVGLVHFGVCSAGHFMESHDIFKGLDRDGVRLSAVDEALNLLLMTVEALKH